MAHWIHDEGHCHSLKDVLQVIVGLPIQALLQIFEDM